MPGRKDPIVFEVQVFFEKEDGGGYHTYVPALPGLHSCGDTIAEAKKNTREAIVAYLTSLIKHNDPIPLSCIHYGKRAAKRKWHMPAAPYRDEIVQVNV